MNTDINAVWSKALSAIKSVEKAKNKVAEILEDLRDNHDVTRQDALKVMKEWMEKGHFGRTTMFGYLNSVWPTAESDKRGGRQADPELSEMAEELLSLAVESYGEKARSVLLAAWKLSKSE
jgi:hypothetical protein